MTQAELVADLVRRAGTASERLAELRTDVKDAALRQAADALEDASASILRANAQDLEAGRSRGLEAPLLDRLTLNPERISAIAAGLREVAALPDPIGEITRM